MNIEEKDCKFNTYRRSNQKLNQAESAVRVTHIETGVYAECGLYKSYFRNRELAFATLVIKMESFDKNTFPAKHLG